MTRPIWQRDPIPAVKTYPQQFRVSDGDAHISSFEVRHLAVLRFFERLHTIDPDGNPVTQSRVYRSVVGEYCATPNAAIRSVTALHESRA